MGKISIFVNEGGTLTYHDVDHVYLVMHEGIEFEGKDGPHNEQHVWKFSFKSFVWWEAEKTVRIHIHKSSIF